MISDRPMSKLKRGLPMKLSILQMAMLLVAIIIAFSHTPAETYGTDLDNTGLVLLLFTGSLILNLVYIIGGPKLIPELSSSSEE